jgi:CSLREA domain-containing protein
MGDASLPFAESYTATGDAALQAAMLTISRIYPVPDGIGTLTNGVGGLRYSVTSGLLDLKPLLGSDGRFCGTGGSSGNFNAIKALLAQYLQSWNAANGAGNQADRVLGVVDAAISNGSAAGCAEGMAAINSPEAWIRAVPETDGTPSQSGLVAALELGHTFGMVLETRDDPFSKFHSPNVYADPARTNRSYNTRLRSVIVDDRTAMTFSGGANNNNTLLEQLDWAYLICRLGGATSSECPAPAVPIGSGAGVAAGPRFVISGTTDGILAGTQIVESFFSADQLPTPPDPQSALRLVYRNGAAIVADIGLPTSSEDSAHDHDGASDPNHPAGRSLFSGAFDFQTDATRIELWQGAPGSGQLLYARDRTAPPVLESLSVIGDNEGEAQNYTNDPDADDVEAAISADGQWVAWSALDLTNEGEHYVVRVAPVDDATSAWPLVVDDQEVNSFEPAWCADGTQLAYVDDDGDLWRIDVDTSDGVSFGTPFQLYDSDGYYTPYAHDPTWSPDCSQLAFERDGDIWRIDADATNEVALTDDGASFDPSWSPDPEDNRIAFVAQPQITFLSAKLTSPLDSPYVLASFVRPNDAPLETADLGAQFVVNSADDLDDGTCDAAHCSLREAINAANASTGTTEPDEIDFAISPSGAHTIGVTSALPAIIDPVIIDATTQPGYDTAPVIELDGTDAGANVDGLLVGIGGAASTIRGLAINAFSQDGIRVFGDDVAIEGSYIGLGLDGTTDRGNAGIGVQVIGASGTRIGTGVDVGSGNVISGNGWHGISVNGGSPTEPIVGTVIGGNLIGTDAAGSAAVGNAGYGILLNATTQGALVGGLSGAQRNVISGNVFGIVLVTGADGNVVQGNYIGTDASGTADLGNTSHGIDITGAGGTMIGGHAAGAGNVISGNGDAINAANGIRISSSPSQNQVYGNLIGTDVTGTLPLGNSTSGVVITADSDENRIGSTGAGGANTIAYNGETGIAVDGGTGNTIRGNAIHDNGALGIDIGPAGVTPNDAGDADTGANDLQNAPIIETAGYDGSSTSVTGTINSVGEATLTIDIFVSDACDPSGSGEGAQWLAQRAVDSDASGDATFSAAGLSAVPGEVITATAAEGVSNSSSEFSACVTVTGSTEDPTFVVNASDDTDDGLCGTLHCSLREAINRANDLEGNDTITFAIPGTGPFTIAPATPLPVISDQVVIDGTTQPGYDGAPAIAIDGSSAGSGANGLELAADGSTISGLAVVNFSGAGIRIASGASNEIRASYIGIGLDGATPGPNGVGISVSGSSTVIGGDSTADRNVISGNAGDGIVVFGDAELETFASGNVITGNLVGTDAAGTSDMGNGGDGIHLEIVTEDNVIGGDTTEFPMRANVISGNGGSGVTIELSYGNVVQGNLIGVDLAATEPLGNDGAGVRITAPSQMNQIGASHIGTSITGPGNTIAYNGGNGVEVVSAESAFADADFNSILSNAIHDNEGLGIDLEADGITPNDPLDADDGSNDLKNFPDSVSGTSDGFTTFGTVGSNNSAPSEIIVYQVFANDECDPSGNGEGQRLVATVATSADETGAASATFFVEEDLDGQWLTATTADNQGQTSEFSACSLVSFDDGSSADAEIRLLNASIPLEPTELLVEDGDDPFWGPAGILYAVDGQIHSIAPDGSADQVLTDGEAFDGEPAAGLGVIGFTRQPGESPGDIFLIRTGSATVTVTASDETPDQLRLDLYYACGGQVLPIAVGITPDQTAGTTASFQINFDPSLSCAGGEILAALTDGFLRTITPPGGGTPVSSEDKAPIASTYGPPLGDTYLTSAVIPFHGTGEDAEDGTLTGSSLSWFIRPSGDPCCGSAAGSGGSVDYDASQLAPGDYVVTLVVTDTHGQTGVAESLIHVLADNDHDGFSDVDETTTCFGAGAATDGSTPSGDADGDGIPNASDVEPCVAQSLFVGIADFDPDELNLTSAGSTVTVAIRLPQRDIRQISGATVRIVAVGSQPLTLGNIGWSVKKGVGTAKFGRQALIDFLTSHGVEDTSVSITVAGTSSTNPTWTFEATDATFVKR